MYLERDFQCTGRAIGIHGAAVRLCDSSARRTAETPQLEEEAGIETAERPVMANVPGEYARECLWR